MYDNTRRKDVKLIRRCPSFTNVGVPIDARSGSHVRWRLLLLFLFRLLQTAQPKLEEVGPFGYVKRTTKYDVRFSADDSDSVTYRSWTVFEEVRARW